MIALAGNRVGIIDTDIQSPGIHVIFALDQEKVTYALNDYLRGRCPIDKAAYDVTLAASNGAASVDPQTRLLLIPSSIKTGEIAHVLREGYDVGLLNDGIHTL